MFQTYSNTSAAILSIISAIAWKESSY